MKSQKKTANSPKLEKSSADTPTFRWNDEVVTEQQYNDLIEDHKNWTAALAAALEESMVEDKPIRRSKKK